MGGQLKPRPKVRLPDDNECLDILISAYAPTPVSSVRRRSSRRRFTHSPKFAPKKQFCLQKDNTLSPIFLIAFAMFALIALAISPWNPLSAMLNTLTMKTTDKATNTRKLSSHAASSHGAKAQVDTAGVKQDQSNPAGEASNESHFDSSCSENVEKQRKRAHAAFQTRLEAGYVQQRTTTDSIAAQARSCRNDWSEEVPSLNLALSLHHPNSHLYSASSLPTASGITLIAPLPIARISAVEDICTLWPKLPMVAALYVALHDGKPENYASLEVALQEIRDLSMQTTSTELTCKLTLEVYTEEVCGDWPGPADPINALRNRALRLVRTRGVLLTDGEHLINLGLGRQVQDEDALEMIMQQATVHAGVAIPAFAPTDPWLALAGRHLAIELATTSFRGNLLKRAWGKKKLLAAPEGWALPEKDRIIALKSWDFDSRSFNVTKLGDGASPLAIMLTERVPWYDETLRGGSWAAALHVRHAEALARHQTWSTYGQAWAVRLAPTGISLGNQGGDLQAKRNRAHFNRWQDDAEKGKFVPVVAMEELCYDVLNSS